jgi:hypothetical protein
MSVEFKLSGVPQMASKMEAVSRMVENELENSILKEAEAVKIRVQQEFIPVDKGDLRDSGKVSTIKREGKVVSADISFSGPQALAIHEYPSVHSPPTWKSTTVTFNPPGRGPRYLERPLVDSASGMANRMAKDLKL